MPASPETKATHRTRTDIAIAVALWMIVGSLCIALAHTLAASLLQ